MELFEKETKALVCKCDECGNDINKSVSISYKGIDLCETCLIKALLMIRPIKFSKEEINAWLIAKYEYTEESCAEEGLSCPLELDFGKFMDWLKPFL
jgi:hypothetical protein